MQADILAKYKPTINITSLIPELKHVDKFGADSLYYFNSSRHILLYYEDLVNNRTVSSLLLYLVNASLITVQTSLTLIAICYAEADGCFGFLKIAQAETFQPSRKNPQEAII